MCTYMLVASKGGQSWTPVNVMQVVFQKGNQQRMVVPPFNCTVAKTQQQQGDEWQKTRLAEEEKRIDHSSSCKAVRRW